MPNYCKNILIVNGPPKLINDLSGYMTTPEGNFDFSAIIPYPAHFAKMDEACKKADKDGTRASGIKDGYNSGGYEWCLEHWGTKWNAGSAEVIKCSLGTMFVFETAWSPPIPVMEELASRFPTLSFELLYFEQGMQKAGVWSRREQDEGEVFDSQHTKWTDYSGLLGG